MTRKLPGFLAAMAGFLLTIGAGQADPVTVTDIVGRNVTVNTPIKRAILGEGRMLYVIAALDRENPASRIAAWRDDLIQADPATYAAY